MSLDHVSAFYSRMATDEAFRSQVQGVESRDEYSQIVKNAGYNFTQEEFEEYTAQLLESSSDNDEIRDLHEKELEAVFGGKCKDKSKGNPIIVQPLYGVVVCDPSLCEPIVQPLYGVVIDSEIA